MPRTSESLAGRNDAPVVPFAVEELEGLAAPSREAFVRGYMRPSRAVILTGLTEGWLPPEEWTIKRMVTHYGSARVVAAVLANGTLLDDPTSGAIFQQVLLRDFVDSLGRSGPASRGDGPIEGLADRAVAPAAEQA